MNRNQEGRSRARGRKQKAEWFNGEQAKQEIPRYQGCSPETNAGGGPAGAGNVWTGDRLAGRCGDKVNELRSWPVWQVKSATVTLYASNEWKLYIS